MSDTEITTRAAALKDAAIEKIKDALDDQYKRGHLSLLSHRVSFEGLAKEFYGLVCIPGESKQSAASAMFEHYIERGELSVFHINSLQLAENILRDLTKNTAARAAAV